MDENSPSTSEDVKLQNCEVCSVQEAKYTCPKCGVRTCCLLCVNIHKKELNCDGIRDRTKFVYVKDFTNLDLMSDYQLLEESSRFVADKKTNPNRRLLRYDSNLPYNCMILKTAARVRSTLLLFLSKNFTRHKNNTTKFDKKSNTIFWHVEWNLPNAASKPIKLNEICDENTKLIKLVDKYFNTSDGDDAFAYYCSAGISNCRFLLKAEKIKSSFKKFHELDIRLSLKDNFAGKCIIEFPIIYIMLKDHSYDFKTVDSDDEMDDCEYTKPEGDHDRGKKPRELFTVTIAKQQKLKIENEILEAQNKAPKNYLFGSNCSSDED